jgi:hypothetical protein
MNKEKEKRDKFSEKKRDPILCCRSTVPQMES